MEVTKYGGIHWLMIVGIFVFLIPVVANFFHAQLPIIITKIGILVLCLGLVLTVYYAMRAKVTA
jgi:hypothetical protein